VRVERVAREGGEGLDVLERHRARRRHHLVADAQLSERLAERVLPAGPRRRALVPHPGERGEHLGRALHGGALHVVQHRTDAAELLAAARATGSAVHEVRQRRAVTRRGARVVAVEEQHAAVVRGDARRERDRHRGSCVATLVTSEPPPRATSAVASSSES
jgi:hypothetical protein